MDRRVVVAHPSMRHTDAQVAEWQREQALLKADYRWVCIPLALVALLILLASVMSGGLVIPKQAFLVM